MSDLGPPLPSLFDDLDPHASHETVSYTHIIRLTIHEQVAIKLLSMEKGMSEAIVLRQALRLYQLVHAHSKRGHTMIFVDKDGRQVHDFPVGCPALD